MRKLLRGSLRADFSAGTGLPAVSAAVLRKLAGNPSEGKWGEAHKHFLRRGEGEEAAQEACFALDALCSMGSIDTMISNFLVPLQVGLHSTAQHGLALAMMYDPIVSWPSRCRVRRSSWTNTAASTAGGCAKSLASASSTVSYVLTKRGFVCVYDQLEPQHRDGPALRAAAEPAEPAGAGQGPVQDPQGLRQRAGQEPGGGGLRAAGAAPHGPHHQLR